MIGLEIRWGCYFTRVFYERDLKSHIYYKKKQRAVGVDSYEREIYYLKGVGMARDKVIAIERR